LKFALTNIGLELIARDVTEPLVKKQLKKIIPKLSGETLTYQDWFEGGSYNLLSLDHGRYYVEHCLEFFEKNYSLASALASTFRAIPELAESLGYSRKTVSLFSNMLLKGLSPEDLHRRWPQWSISTVKNVHRGLTNYFIAAYQQAQFEAALMQDTTLKLFVHACGLQSSPENIDRMRIILWGWLREKNKIETQQLLDECQKSIPWTVFQKQLGVVKSRCNHQLYQIPTTLDYQAIGLTDGNIRDSTSTYPRQLIHLVSKAGLTNAIALTGWRSSEFGFPHSAIKRTRNQDKLDQHALPWRYQVDWYVYKTSGNIRQLREITFSTTLIAERLQSLVNTSDEQPCLYSVSETNKHPFDSRNVVRKAVRKLWGHFVNHYSSFKQLDDWTTWQTLQEVHDSGKSLTKVEQQEFGRLLAQFSAKEWANLSIDTNLKEAWRRAREEWPRLEIFLTASSKQDKKDWLLHYRNGTLRPNWVALLDTHLPNETKDWIQSLAQEELKSKNVTRTVMNNLIEGTLYPSPHAFRHMWAEAVYRRFDGDAGWMIRSQFKHISRSMWLAYIRDKDNRGGHQRVKTQVISSLVHNYLKNKGEGYAGQFHVWLRRLFRKTTVLTQEEQVQLADRLATIEIENIKASPWGYCLLKRRTRNKAKCAEMGEPMRHNATPELCFGCIHNLMQTTNVEWALFHVASHLEAMKNPIVPAIFKASSYELVKNVTRHVRTLNPHHEALHELQEVLDNYKASRAA
jgi:hypothetical protein